MYTSDSNKVQGGSYSCHFIAAAVEVRLPPYNTPVVVEMDDKTGGRGEAGESRLDRLLRRRRHTKQPAQVSLQWFSMQLLFLMSYMITYSLTLKMPYHIKELIEIFYIKKF